jgi:hypothetical protein
MVPAITIIAALAQAAAKRLGMADRRVATIAVMSGFGLIYLSYLIISATRIAIEAINSRFINLLYAPAVFIFVAAADLILSKLAGVPGKVYRALLVLTLCTPFALAVSMVKSSWDNGAGSYSTSEWRNNLILRELQTRPPDDCTYYSNAPDAVYAVTGIHAYWPPKKSGPPMYGFEAFRRRVAGDACTYVVWFGNGPGGGLYGIEDLEKLFRVDLVERNSAGSIYRLVLR